MKRDDINRSWALLFARLVLGLIFFMAGLWKTFQLGPLEMPASISCHFLIHFCRYGRCGLLEL